MKPRSVSVFAPFRSRNGICIPIGDAIRYLTLTILVLHWYPLSEPSFCLATDSITPNQKVPDGKTIVSARGVFELGFFSLPGSNNARYVGIWLKNFPNEKILWVANRKNPVTDLSGSLMIRADGNLVVADAKNNTVWSSNVTLPSSHSVSATLDDTGNLVLKSNGQVVWDSFNHPVDSILPGMKIGTNTVTGVRLTTTSWKNERDPSVGDFVLMVDPQEQPQVIIMNGLAKHWRSGQWTGRSFIGIPNVAKDNGADVNLEGKDTNVNFTFSSVNNMSNQPVIYLNYTGDLIFMEWHQEVSQWRKQKLALLDPCDLYNTCGSFGTCDNNISPICKCLKGYIPKSMNEWSRGNWTSGCRRRTKYQCEGNTTAAADDKADGFVALTGMKLPDFPHYVYTTGISECRSVCLQNCSCLACAYVDGLGCMLWGDDLIDLREFPSGGEALHIRLAYSELGGKTKITAPVIVTVVVSVTLIVSFVMYILFRWRKRGAGRGAINILKEVIAQGGSSQVPNFSLQSIEAATNKFSETNKLGEGGFGPVYKGRLSDGQEIAVKRLARSSGQGAQEFKNEVLLISKLQHRSLVKLLGFCIKGEERMLVYEYMPNKSLDKLIFGSNEDVVPDWGLRYRIIEGIARGLLYLHRDSRLKIIHRDLKTSNILLDEHMNPKISDFGMARIFGGDQSKANTNRIVGTYGYMSPEYAMQGIFSEKSNVFSFGVLLLEIVSSKKINGFYHLENFQSLLGYAWQLWNEGKAFELLDSRLDNACNPTQVTRCIQIALLCVQQHANDRPTMSMVVSMLSNEMGLPSPDRPAFSSNERLHESNPSLHTSFTCSRNGISITSVGGR